MDHSSPNLSRPSIGSKRPHEESDHGVSKRQRVVHTYAEHNDLDKEASFQIQQNCGANSSYPTWSGLNPFDYTPDIRRGQRVVQCAGEHDGQISTFRSVPAYKSLSHYGHASPNTYVRAMDSRPPDSRPPDSRPPDSRPPDLLSTYFLGSATDQRLPHQYQHIGDGFEDAESARGPVFPAQNWQDPQYAHSESIPPAYDYHFGQQSFVTGGRAIQPIHRPLQFAEQQNNHQSTISSGRSRDPRMIQPHYSGSPDNPHPRYPAFTSAKHVGYAAQQHAPLNLTQPPQTVVHGITKAVLGSSAQTPIDLDDLSSPSRPFRSASSESYNPGDETPPTAHSGSGSPQHALASPRSRAKRAREIEEDEAERAAKKAKTEAGVDADLKLYDDNMELIERFCLTRQNLKKVKWFVKLDAWKRATHRILPSTKTAVPDDNTSQRPVDSTGPGKPDTFVRDALAKGSRPDKIKHPRDKVCVPDYPSDDDIDTCTQMGDGRYYCTHDFGNLKCCKEGLDRSGKLSSINKQMNAWRAKVERLIMSHDLHATHKTWDRCYDSDLRKKEIEAQNTAKSAAQAAQAAQMQAQTKPQQAERVETAPPRVVVADPVTTPAVEPLSETALPQSIEDQDQDQPEPDLTMTPPQHALDSHINEEQTPMLWADGSIFDLDAYLQNPYVLDNDYDKFLVGDPAAVQRVTNSFFGFIVAQAARESRVPPASAVSNHTDTDGSMLSFNAIPTGNKPIAKEDDRFLGKEPKIVYDTIESSIDHSEGKPSQEYPHAGEVSTVDKTASNNAQVNKAAPKAERIVSVSAAKEGETPTARKALDPTLVRALKQHDRLHRDAQDREHRKQWPNLERLNAWWSATRRKVQGLPLTPEELELLQQAEPSWLADRRPPTTEHVEPIEVGEIDEDDLDDLFVDKDDDTSLFGDGELL
ncbi:hypothetical protein P153DRAFT_416059 [Dothidotthia symphoricarpi CBS 119687]|uniref:Uncharacterized protein n=1 Tax=Dothidotthia symphoricarpi CBS 119687 TaxID=1392245 RepID=A0A6A6AMP2_9PLEO|nr:uncharacterized protein P153DRAFT_416059 [Dothidotthia symphoricarpi CBS 119687]KAF2132443.1 hypothetical protein P153DRAFT_416059 [Dothidotthia symphoricarpi CBS 119687]